MRWEAVLFASCTGTGSPVTCPRLHVISRHQLQAYITTQGNPVYLYSSVITEPYNPSERPTRQIAQINLRQHLAYPCIAKDVAGAYVDPKHEHTTPLPPLLPYQCPRQLSENNIFWYLTVTPERVWKTSPGEGKQKTAITKQKSWLISQEEQCQTWLASSTSKYILPTSMPLFSSLKFFTPPSEGSLQHCNHSPAARSLQHQAGSPPSLLCSLVLYKAPTGQDASQN